MNVHSITTHRSSKWKQSKEQSTDEWIKRLWNIHTMEDYLDIKKNEVLIQAAMWMNLENVKLVKGASYRRSHTVQFYLYRLSRIGKFMET